MTRRTKAATTSVSTSAATQPHAHKARCGLERLRYATIYGLHGLRAAWQGKAFRMESCLAFVMVPACGQHSAGDGSAQQRY